MAYAGWFWLFRIGKRHGYGSPKEQDGERLEGHVRAVGQESEGSQEGIGGCISPSM